MMTKNDKVGGLVRGFFFDLDGTLVDTHESNFRAYKQAVEHVTGVRLGGELKKNIKAGESSADFLPKVLPSVTQDEINAINKMKKKVYPNHLHASSPNEYLKIFLEQMYNQHITVLVTTAKRKNALAVLKAHNIDKYFTHAIFGEDVSLMKPNPEAYNLALEITGLLANEVIAFEDSEKGIKAALAAGISTIHIRNFL